MAAFLAAAGFAAQLAVQRKQNKAALEAQKKRQAPKGGGKMAIGFSGMSGALALAAKQKAQKPSAFSRLVSGFGGKALDLGEVAAAETIKRKFGPKPAPPPVTIIQDNQPPAPPLVMERPPEPGFALGKGTITLIVIGVIAVIALAAVKK